MKNYQAFQLAKFVLGTKYESLDAGILWQLKRHMLDSIGSLAYATGRPTVQKLYRQVLKMGEGGKCKVPGIGNAAVDRAAQVYSPLIDIIYNLDKKKLSDLIAVISAL